MKLIDADELPVTCNVAIVNGKLELNGWIAAKRIEEAPIVKAIPIEWINNWLNKERNAKYFIPMMELIEEWEKETNE